MHRGQARNESKRLMLDFRFAGGPLEPAPGRPANKQGASVS